MNIYSYCLDCSQIQQWKGFLSLFPPDLQDIYYYPEYVKLYETDCIKGKCFVCQEGSKTFLYPFMLQGIPGVNKTYDISTPYGYGGPIVNTYDEQFLLMSYQSLSSYFSENNVIAELIKFHPINGVLQNIQHVYPGDLIKTCPTVDVDLQIDDEEYRWSSVYTHANRKNINKARRNGVVISFAKDCESWKHFCQLYESNLTRNCADSRYFFSEDYYQAIRSTLSDQYVIVTATIEGNTLSSLLVLLGETMAHCHLIGTDPSARKLGVNNLLHHELILWLKQKQYKKLHIGGGFSNSIDDPLLRFKMNFSKNLNYLHVGERVINQKLYQALCDSVIHQQAPVVNNKLFKYRVT